MKTGMTTRRWSALGLVTFAAVAVGASSASAQQAPSAPRARSFSYTYCSGCDDDSLAVLRARAALERVTSEHERLLRALDESRQSTADVEATRRRLTQLQQQMMSLSMQLSAARPRGWIGVTFQGEPTQFYNEGYWTVRYPVPPEIIAVDPNSPADRAGVHRGDTLLAMNGLDVRKGLPISRILQPDKRVTLKLRRDGDVREIPVSVAKAPDMVVRRRMELVGPMAAGGPQPARAPEPPTIFRRSQGAAEFHAVNPDSIESIQVIKSGEGTTSVFVFPRRDGLAGAEMRNIGADLAELTGVSRGVFVVETAASSPAREAGLRGGDVIVGAEGDEIDTVAELRALAMKVTRESKQGERTLRLDVVRSGGKKRTVTLKW